MNRQKILDYCLDEAKNGKDFGQLRKELKELGLADDEINEFISYVDNQMINEALKGTQRNSKKEYYLMGWFLLAVGAFITITTYTGVISMGNSYIISFGPIIAGLGLIVSNRPSS